MLSLGITGSLGVGKSAAADYFKQLGARIYDADREAKNILLNSHELQEVVIQTFGDQVLDDAGGLDLKRLGRVAFASPEEQARLNGIIHPEVVQSILEQITKTSESETKLFIVDAPLLFEAHLEQLLDLTLVVNSRVDIRIRRAMERGKLSEEEIRERMKLQLPNAEKVARADIVVDNNGTLEEFQAKLQMVYNDLQLTN